MTRMPTERPPTHPGEMMIEEFLTPLGVTQSAFAKVIDVSFPRLNELVKGKRGVTPDTALRLERVLGASAGFWMNLQSSWDLWQLKHSGAAKAIEALKPLKATA
jgi:addiction module HigA family antidote